jgi:hypothetical protein
MKKKLMTILLAFGMTKALADKHLATVPDEDDPTFDADKFIADAKANEKELLRNDKEFVGDIQKAEGAKRNEMWRTKIKRETGLTAEEIKDKTDEEIVKMAVEKLRKKGDQTLEQLQAENVKLTADLKKVMEEDLPGKDLEVANHKKAITIEAKLEKKVMSLPKKLRIGTIAAIATVREKLGSNYIIDLDDSGEIQILTKDKLKPKSKDGSSFLTADQLLTEILDSEKALENSGGGGDAGSGGGKKTGDGITITEDEKKSKLHERYPNLKKAEEEMAKQKELLEARKKEGVQ